MTCKDVGKRISELAEERGYSAYHVWKLCGCRISLATVYNALEGKNIKLETLFFICDALEVSLQEFFEFDIGLHLTRDEEDFIEILRKLDPQQYQRLLGYASSLSEKTE